VQKNLAARSFAGRSRMAMTKNLPGRLRARR
jgi:hypothetical protein